MIYRNNILSGSYDGTLTILIDGNLTQTKVNMAIDAHAAQTQKLLHTLFLGEFINTIGPSAISGTGLRSIQFHPQSRVRTIESGAFSHNNLLTTLVLPPGLKHVPSMMCADCVSLGGDFSLPPSVESIGYRAFHNCQTLVTMTIPAGVTILVDEIFRGCSMLQFVNFAPDSTVSIIGDAMFASCTSLQTIVLPESLSILGLSTFQSCTSLHDVTFPSTLTVCGLDTFKDASRVKSLTMNVNLWSSVASSLEPHDQGLDQFVYSGTKTYTVDRRIPGVPTLKLTTLFLVPTKSIPWYNSYLFYVSIIGGLVLIVGIVVAVVKNNHQKKKKSVVVQNK
jgi:hypothetical protein